MIKWIKNKIRTKQKRKAFQAWKPSQIFAAFYSLNHIYRREYYEALSRDSQEEILNESKYWGTSIEDLFKGRIRIKHYEENQTNI